MPVYEFRCKACGAYVSLFVRSVTPDPHGACDRCGSADLERLVSRFAVHPYAVIGAICAIYVVLGTAMEELSMILLTMPVFFPVIVHLGFDPVWFGIIIVCVVEIGLISPPVGMNMFVLKTLLPHVPTGTVFRGVMPFMWADVIRLALLVAFPIISLWLPSFMR